MILQHPFAAQTNLSILLEGTHSLASYLKKLRAFAKTKRPAKLDKDEKCDAQLKCIGDGFELFGEFFLKFQAATDNRIWVRDFKHLTITDNGVDGVGICSRDGIPVYIQFKCYKEHEYLTGVESHLDSFVSEAWMLEWDRYAIDNTPSVPPRLLVITSSAGIHEYTDKEKYRGRVKCFPYKELGRLTEAPIFWDTFRESAHI